MSSQADSSQAKLVGGGESSASLSPVEASSSSLSPAEASSALSSPTSSPSRQTRLYKRRWLMLLIFCAYSATNAFQWLEYASINNVVGKFYAKDSQTVDWLGMIYEAVYIPLIFPANWLLDSQGLMPVVLLGAFGNALGAVLKVASADKGLFVVTFAGQTVAAIAQIFVLGIPANLAAVWFGPKEVSTATALGVFGNQVGNALGFFLPPLFVPRPDPWDDEEAKRSLQLMFYVMAGVTVALFVLVVAVFKGQPELPPSRAQALKRSAKENYAASMRELCRQPTFLLICLTYGLLVGTFYAVSTLLNQIILSYFPGAEKEVGEIGLILVVTGMAGSLAIGFWLDRFRKYKATTLAVYVLTLAGMGGFTLALPFGKMWLVFLMSGVLGLFMSSYLPLGFELAAELLYPASEGTTSGLLNCSAQVFGIALTIGGGKLMAAFSTQACLLLFCAVLALGAALTAFIKEDLRRQRAEGKLPVSAEAPEASNASQAQPDPHSSFVERF